MADEEHKGEQASTPSDEDELESKLAAFDEKVKAAGATRMPEVPDWSYKRSPVNDGGSGLGHRSLGIGMTAAYVLLGGMVVGFGGGWLVDRAAHTSPLWQVVFSVLGTVLGLVYVIVLVNREGTRK